jgi:hypothetical protein
MLPFALVCQTKLPVSSNLRHRTSWRILPQTPFSRFAGCVATGRARSLPRMGEHYNQPREASKGIRRPERSEPGGSWGSWGLTPQENPISILAIEAIQASSCWFHFEGMQITVPPSLAAPLNKTKNQIYSELSQL